jgi:uncharacterized delta-60 repeat protein
VLLAWNPYTLLDAGFQLWQDAVADIAPFVAAARERGAASGSASTREKEELIVRRFYTKDRTAPKHRYALSDPWLRIATCDAVLDIVNGYAGEQMRLTYLDNWYTVPHPDGAERVASQRWHRDPEDEHIVKMFIYLVVSVCESTIGGKLDGAFGTGGKVLGGLRSATAIAVQADGKIVAVGYQKDVDGDDDFALVWYATDGELDLAVVSALRAQGDDSASDVALQRDGKIVVADDKLVVVVPMLSTSDNEHDFALARYTTGGKLDKSLGAGGNVTGLGTKRDDTASAVAIQNDGKIIAAGGSSDHKDVSDVALVRTQNDDRGQLSRASFMRDTGGDQWRTSRRFSSLSRVNRAGFGHRWR